MRPARLALRVAAEHAGDLGDAIGIRENRHVGCRYSGGRSFGDEDMAMGARRDLWQMRDREHLMRRGDLAETVNAAEPSCEDDPETRTDVRRAFARLSTRERQLLWLAHVEGFDHREIARLTGLRAASVRVLLFRARRELASALRGHSHVGRGVEL